MNRFRARILANAATLVLLAWTGTLRAQDVQLPKPVAPDIYQGAVVNKGAPCIQPPPMVRIQDYNGPFAKTVGFFSGNLERKTVHPAHFKPGMLLCSLELKDKFFLFVRDSYDPATIASVAFNAGISQAQNTDPTFGPGVSGYGKRFGASYADQASVRFFKDFAYPSIFSEDPRYYRLAHGSTRRRLLHPIEHALVAHTDHGNPMFNFSEWLGTASTIALSNTYHPGNKRGFAPAAEAFGISFGNDIGFDELREFWPEIAHKFKLPFRSETLPNDSGPTPETR
jgi:hypothetical protein